MRGRQTAAMLRILGIEELIASDEEQYVMLALRVGSDKTYRDRIVCAYSQRLAEAVRSK